MSVRVAKQAEKACVALELAQKVVAVVGILLAIGAVVGGFLVPEPWTYGPLQATEEWHSYAAGIVGGIVILVQTLVVYAVLGALDAKVEETLAAHWEEPAGSSDIAGS